MTVHWISQTKPAGTLLQARVDPFSPFLSGGSGALGLYHLTTSGLYYTPNVLTTTPTWTQKLAISPTAGRIIPSNVASGVIYVDYVTADGTSVINVKKLSAYGATADWTQTVGSAHNGNSSIAMDVDTHGADEMLVGAYDSAVGGGSASIYRITNGGSPSRITGTTVAGGVITYLQKPILTFAGAPNDNTGSSECFVYATAGGSSATYNFASGDGGWTANDIGGGPLAIYHAGVGWSDNYPPNANDGIYIISPTFAALPIGQVDVTFSTNWGGTNPKISIMNLAETVLYGSSTASGATTISITCGGTTVTQIEVIADPYIGSKEHFAGYITKIVVSGTGGTAGLKKTSNGGSTITDITPAGFTGSVPCTANSIMATDDANFMAVISNGGGLWTSTNGGTSWSSRIGDITNASVTIGLFPRLMNGQHGLYIAGSTKLAFSPDSGVTLIDKTGDFASAVGAVGGWHSVLPLY